MKIAFIIAGSLVAAFAAGFLWEIIKMTFYIGGKAAEDFMTWLVK
jgi:hypothetical protein